MVKAKLIGVIMILLSVLIFNYVTLFIVKTLSDLVFLTMGILIAELIGCGILLFDRDIKRKKK